LKKIYLLLIAIFMFAATTDGRMHLETPPADPISLTEILDPPMPRPKSVITLPISASFNQELSMICLSTNTPQGILMVSIEDELGYLLFQQMVDGDQSVIEIPLPSLTDGFYKLTIKSSARLFAGVFEVY
jgi:hypothetical protein